jgi:FlaA1/EpsC-like NDP-sugar epimerase
MLFNRPGFSWPDQQDLASEIAGKIVLVTGAGGSIGSALCLHIASLKPCKLVILGRGEHSLYSVSRRLLAYPDVDFDLALVDIQNLQQLEYTLALHKPDIAFHVAAYKHVNMLERFPCQAVLNNVLGTQNVMLVCQEARVERLVSISTDKAVEPTSILGATKKLCECMLRKHAQNSATDLVSVRFGNVFRSSGNVVTLFKQQAQTDRRITITDPNAQRFYMDIEDATQTVLCATKEALSGEVAILDMGEPITIGALADGLVKSLGLKPHDDVHYEYVGLQPGEKLLERLYTYAEEERMRRVGPMMFTQTDMGENVLYDERAVEELIDSARVQYDDQVRSLLTETVPGYIPIHSE